MLTWNIGNTTVRNPQRILAALPLFAAAMGGRPFDKAAQHAFQDLMVTNGLVEVKPDAAAKPDYESGARKFASCFKQLGFITDWSAKQPWRLTPVGTVLLAHPELVDTLFLRQLLKYQIPSPLEEEGRSGSLRLRPFRLLLRFLMRALSEGLVGLTKNELGLFVVTLMTEEGAAFEDAWQRLRTFRDEMVELPGVNARKTYAKERRLELARLLNKQPDTFTDYADSTSRYALMSGLLTTYGDKLAVLVARRPFVDALLTDDPGLVIDETYLDWFYDAERPWLPSDDVVFLLRESRELAAEVAQLAAATGRSESVPPPPSDRRLTELRAYERRLRQQRLVLKEVDFAHDHHARRPLYHLAEISDILDQIVKRGGELIAGQEYRAALLEWAIWRLFLVIGHFQVDVTRTHGFRLDEDLHPISHAPGGAGDLLLTYDEYTIVCEMTLLTGSRQFAAEGEPVTRHVYRASAAQTDLGRPVFGLFIAPSIDPNTVDLYHDARYWPNWQTAVATPVVAMTIADVREMIDRMKEVMITPADLRQLLEDILDLQSAHASGPEWFQASRQVYQEWLNSLTIARTTASIGSDGSVALDQ